MKAMSSVRLWIGGLTAVLLLAACGTGAAGVMSGKSTSSHPSVVTTNADTDNTTGSAAERQAPAATHPDHQSAPAAPAQTPFPNIKSGGLLPEPGGCGIVLPQRPGPKLLCAAPE